MKKSIKTVIWILAVVAIIGAAIFYVKHKKPTTTFTTADVTNGTLIQTVSVTGEINPETQFDLAFKSSGILNKMAAVGSEVAANSEIASLQKKSLTLELLQSQKDIQYQQKLLASMKKNTSTYNKDQRAAQQALVEKSQISQSISAQNIKDASIFSPVDGIVTNNDFQTGEMVAAGQVAMSVITKDLIINSKVPESDIVKLALAQHAKITFDALTPQDIFDGEVVQIDPASTTIQDVVYYNIKLKLDSADSRIKPGMSANIDVATAQENDVVIAPMRAINTDGNQKFVTVLEADNITTKKINVQTGLEGDDGMVEIKSGLGGGERVVTFSATK